MVHERIRALRMERRLREEDMAERLGISQSTYCRLERGESKLDLERMQKIAEVLEVTLEHLLSTGPIAPPVEHDRGGSNGWYDLMRHFPEEFLRQMMDRYDAHMQELQAMNKRLLALLEQKQG